MHRVLCLPVRTLTRHRRQYSMIAKLARDSVQATLGSTPLQPDVDAENWLLDGRSTVDMSKFPRAGSLDPFEPVKGEMAQLVDNIKSLLGVNHPLLSTVAKYFFENDRGKKVRPALVLLMSYAVNATKETGSAPVAISPKQRRLAEITELIHTASLLHDDVVDMADTRRGVSSVNHVFGNKLAVLGGDFLLARASVTLARLRNVDVVELLSTVIEHLVRGEVMQLKHALKDKLPVPEIFDMYLKKSYYKTASLMANSCKASAMLEGCSDVVSDAAFHYGKHLGIAFQLVDDLLDFEGTLSSLGKPSLNDLKQGLATAPVLFASYTHPQVLELMARRFEAPNDVNTACGFVEKSDGLNKTKQLAYAHAEKALEALSVLPSSLHRDSLAALALKVIHRSS